MNTISFSVARIIARIRFAILNFFDRNLDDLLGDLSKLAARLDSKVDRAGRRFDALVDAEIASLVREQAARDAERSHRGTLAAQQSSLIEEQARARRIRERIASLID